MTEAGEPLTLAEINESISKLIELGGQTQDPMQFFHCGKRYTMPEFTQLVTALAKNQWQEYIKLRNELGVKIELIGEN